MATVDVRRLVKFRTMEALLVLQGILRPNTLVQIFGIKAAQASRVIAAYNKKRPDVIAYDKSKKVWFAKRGYAVTPEWWARNNFIGGNEDPLSFLNAVIKVQGVTMNAVRSNSSPLTQAELLGE